MLALIEHGECIAEYSRFADRGRIIMHVRNNQLVMQYFIMQDSCSSKFDVRSKMWKYPQGNNLRQSIIICYHFQWIDLSNKSSNKLNIS